MKKILKEVFVFDNIYLFFIQYISSQMKFKMYKIYKAINFQHFYNGLQFILILFHYFILFYFIIYKYLIYIYNANILMILQIFK